MAGRKDVNVRLSEARVLYYRYMQDCGLAENTVATARSTLSALEHVIGNKVVRNIDWQDITVYLSARQSEPTRPGQLPRLVQSTLKLQMHRLKMFYEWAVRFKYADPQTDWMAGRKRIKVTPEKRARVEAQDFPALLDAAPNPRDRIVLALGLYTLMRGGEIRGLRIADLQMQDHLLQMVRYKTRERDELAISSELRQELITYLDWYCENTGTAKVEDLPNEWYLVPTNQRRSPTRDDETYRFRPASRDAVILVPTTPLYAQASSEIVQRALRSIGWDVTAKEGGHTLRRSAARELFETMRGRGFDDAIMVVMSWLGHKNPRTTMIYLGLDKEADRRNKLYKNAIMYPRVTAEQAASDKVIPLRPAAGDQ